MVTSVADTPSAGTSVTRIGTSCERVMVGQRVKQIKGNVDELNVGDSMADTVASLDAMKGFVRNNQYLSLCGLNCKLCPMNLAGHCSGCGVDNQSCKIAKCSIEHGKIEYCFQCTSFPCDKYAHIDDFDSFITHHNQMNDMEKASQIGIPAYNAEQEEKRKLLDFLLSHYNDGRRKNLFCVAVNLLTIKEIENILQTVKSDKDFQSMGKKEQASVIAKLLQDIAAPKGIELKLRKK